MCTMNMNNFSRRFERLRKFPRKIFIPFVEATHITCRLWKSDLRKEEKTLILADISPDPISLISHLDVEVDINDKKEKRKKKS